ncbi:peptidoglycan D,D-transpeptidase FtsI family protein [Coprococcus eutactus]|uniref:peptidoglycan D,D-transpeptidase FtsI family protein n=1 Tax=Coprococcus eutactus TaxID=33043 RepID=UPI00015EA311|nr:penicillin-binding transpeptidase domain-containing protein [Coprococcus eutactus]EDP24957.1 penicillin-binding protein, transpeptidase domain protein [Coprococcus eutactus ATCC 27759]UWP17918.1 penicillin-binding transpeptidase domain-containing protein [Coprococcus eutactus]
MQDDRVKVYSYNRRRIKYIFVMVCIAATVIIGRLAYIMVLKAKYYSERADNLHERERSIKAPRGRIYDRNGNILADNRAVCSVSVIHSQIEDEEAVIDLLEKYLDKSPEEIRKKVTKVSSREIIAVNVSEETGDMIRAAALPGIKVDEDYKRNYPYDELASKMLGFTGADNQGILGLEVSYDSVLTGVPGSINAVTDARGIELAEYAETRNDPIPGDDLVTTIDINIQKYATQAAYKVMTEKNANRVCVLVMNPQNGEIYAMVDAPEYNLNKPFELINDGEKSAESTENGIEKDTDARKEEANDQASGNIHTVMSQMDKLNNMWRNYLISDTYEPGSTAKMITLTAALETGAVDKSNSFYCPGYRIVEDRRIRCSKTTGHGSQTLEQALMNSCNPAFMDIGERTGVDGLYEYYHKLGLFDRCGIDLPGEANSIMHKKENVGPVELATISFGQSFQVTPIQFMSAVASVINGGYSITPHIGQKVMDSETGETSVLGFEEKKQVISENTSLQMREMLEKVVAEGGGSKCAIEGYRIGGKTATSEKLPRGTGRYISSFIGFAPADNPVVMAAVLIDEPEGTYYGGTIAAPVVRDIFLNILPYLGIDKVSNEY